MSQFEEVVSHSLPHGASLAAFFAESIQGVGGTTQLPRGYLQRAFQRTRELGGICISDEVRMRMMMVMVMVVVITPPPLPCLVY